MAVDTDDVRDAIPSLYPDNTSGLIDAAKLRSGFNLLADAVDEAIGKAYSDEAAASAGIALTQAGIATTGGSTATAQAVIATAAASVATTQAGIATGGAATSVAARDVTTAARDVTTAARDVTTAARDTAVSAKDAALAAFANFQDSYLGGFATDPTTDIDGSPLEAGDLYFNTVNEFMRVYTGAAWVNAYVSADGVLLLLNNLSDVPSKPLALSTLRGYTTTTTTGGTTTLSVASTLTQRFTGTLAQTIQLPDPSTLALGWKYEIPNSAIGTLTVNSSGGNFLSSIPSGMTAFIRCILASGSTAASWEVILVDNIGGVPVGTTIFGPWVSAPPGTIKQNGALVSRTTFARLFAAIQTRYGAGDGSTTFSVGDLRGEFPRFFDDGRGIDSGRVIGAAQAEAIEAHGHTASEASAGDHTHGLEVYRFNTGSGGGNDGTGSWINSGSFSTGPGWFPFGPTASYGIGRVVNAGAHTHSITVNSAGGPETRPRNVALLACIKY